eukprot:13339739-Ditylum_brightwellii.AAC.1
MTSSSLCADRVWALLCVYSTRPTGRSTYSEGNRFHVRFSIPSKHVVDAHCCFWARFYTAGGGPGASDPRRGTWSYSSGMG